MMLPLIKIGGYLIVLLTWQLSSSSDQTWSRQAGPSAAPHSIGLTQGSRRWVTQPMNLRNFLYTTRGGGRRARVLYADPSPPTLEIGTKVPDHRRQRR